MYEVFEKFHQLWRQHGIALNGQVYMLQFLMCICRAANLSDFELEDMKRLPLSTTRYLRWAKSTNNDEVRRRHFALATRSSIEKCIQENNVVALITYCI